MSISLDILTDLMSAATFLMARLMRLLIAVVMAIPIWLLFHVNLKLRQKLGLALFLCLSFVMIIVAAIRMSGIRASGGTTEDIVWAVLWHQVEACIAVIMVSIITFRSAVVAESSRKSRRPWYSPAESLWKRRKQSGEKVGSLPDIPSATLTGMNTLIHGEAETVADRTHSGDLEESADDVLARFVV